MPAPPPEFQGMNTVRIQPSSRSAWTAADLQIPLSLFNARKAGKNKASLDSASAALYAGQPATAKTILAQL
jgi:hypothetical protein